MTPRRQTFQKRDDNEKKEKRRGSNHDSPHDVRTKED